MAVYEDEATIQFENANALRKYPFADGSSLMDRDGKELSRDVVVDAHVVVPADFVNPESGMEQDALPEVRLSSVHLSPYMVSACFTSKLGTSVDALSVSVAAQNLSPYSTYRLEKLHGSSDIGGVVTFGAIELPGFPETYFLDGAVLHPCCIAMAKPAMLRRFTDLRSGDSVAGDAEIRFSGYVKSERDGKGFSLSLEDGAAEELASECAKATGAEACGATPIRSINGVYPDAHGNIVLWFH